MKIKDFPRTAELEF